MTLKKISPPARCKDKRFCFRSEYVKGRIGERWIYCFYNYAAKVWESKDAIFPEVEEWKEL